MALGSGEKVTYKLPKSDDFPKRFNNMYIGHVKSSNTKFTQFRDTLKGQNAIDITEKET